MYLCDCPSVYVAVRGTCVMAPYGRYTVKNIEFIENCDICARLGRASSLEPEPSLFKPKPGLALMRACSGLGPGFNTLWFNCDETLTLRVRPQNGRLKFKPQANTTVTISSRSSLQDGPSSSFPNTQSSEGRT